MYQKQILMEKLKEATASVLPISLIVMAISFVLVPVDAGLMLSFVIATAMLILGMGLFTLGAEMSMSRIGNYMGSKLTKSRKLPLILTVSFALGVAITVAEPDLQVLAGNVPEIDTTVLILTVSVGVGFFLMLCMVRILFSISLRTMLIVFYAIVFAAAFLSDESILSVAFDSGGVTTGPMTVPFIMALGVDSKRRKCQGRQLRPRRSVLDRADLIGAAARCDLQNAARAGRERHRLRRRHHGRARQGLSACPAGVFMGSDNGAAADRCLLPDFSGHFAQAPQAAFHAHRDWSPPSIRSTNRSKS